MAIIEPRLLKGFRDYDPEEQSSREAAFSKIRSVFERFGFLPLSTPTLEYKDILMGKIGEDEKLIYSFKDNGERDVAMRYDLTVSLARYIAMNQGSLTLPFKRYQIGPVWRADNPQKGRLREFYQCDVDVVGSDSSLADAEVITCLCKALEELGITGYELRINDRRNFSVFGENQVEVTRSIDKMNKIGIDGVTDELQKKGLSGEVIDLAKQVMDGTADLPNRMDLEKLQNQIVALGVSESNIKIDQTIARGLDYYSSTVFEIVLKDKPEFGSITGGGRYDSLVDQFSEKSVPAVGGSIGIDRLFDAMKELDLIKFENPVKVLVTNWGEEFLETNLKIVSDLRANNINTEFYYEATPKLDKQLKYAEKKGIPFAVIIGADEMAKGEAQVKDLNARSQQSVALNDLAGYFPK